MQIFKKIGYSAGCHECFDYFFAQRWCPRQSAWIKAKCICVKQSFDRAAEALKNKGEKNPQWVVYLNK